MSEESEEKIIKEINEKLIEPFYCFPNPTSIELKDSDVKLLENLLDLYQKEKEKNKKLNKEREHIKSNLQVDLVRKGVYAQARGQIKQILDYYENNDKYLENY